MTSSKKLKLFLGFSEVANYYTNLMIGLKECGIDATFLSWGANIRQYDIDKTKSYEQMILHFITDQLVKSVYSKIVFTVIFAIIRLFLMIKYIILCNTFIFSYNASFLGGWDLPVLKLLKKRVIFIYHGSDSRPPYLNGNYIGTNISNSEMSKVTRKLYKRVKWCERYADEIVCLPASGQFFDKSLINFVALGLPFKVPETLPKRSELNSPLKIVHAPSANKSKGTAKFDLIINELQDSGYEINYVVLQNVPNSEVLHQLSNADLLLDELYSDTRLAGLAVEAAAFGVPALVGGYHQDFENYTPSELVAPCFYSEPENVKSTLQMLYQDRKLLREIGDNAHNFVKRNYAPSVVATKLCAICDGSFDRSYLFDPKSIYNFSGWGCEKTELHSHLKKLTEDIGGSYLYLRHNPKLTKIILDYSLS